MPYTNEFERILRKHKRKHFREEAQELAYKEAFELKIPTFRKKEPRYKIQRGHLYDFEF